MIRTKIQQQLTEYHERFSHLLLSLTAEDAEFHQPGKWSAAQHLDHIYRSVAAVDFAFSLPRIFLRWYVGAANRPSRSYDELIARYQEKLEMGGRAGGRFVPKKHSDDQREIIARRLGKRITRLNGKINGYKEDELDKYILPHPLLGKITLREMLFFTIYHVQHHQKGITDQLANKKAGQ